MVPWQCAAVVRPLSVQLCDPRPVVSSIIMTAAPPVLTVYVAAAFDDTISAVLHIFNHAMSAWFCVSTLTTSQSAKLC